MMTHIIGESFYFPLFVGLILLFVKKYLDLSKVNKKTPVTSPSARGDLVSFLVSIN